MFGTYAQRTDSSIAVVESRALDQKQDNVYRYELEHQCGEHRVANVVVERAMHYLWVSDAVHETQSPQMKHDHLPKKSDN